MDGEEPTQATQNVLDPRRLGKQNSGFSDEDISDIICVLHPHTDSARQEVRRLALEGSPHIIGKSEADEVPPDYELEDDASRFEIDPCRNRGNHVIILKLSSQVKAPAAGFAFGRNSSRCDVVFVNDPLRRVSNIHFRIYVNEHGVVMIEDQSTNGTFVDRQLLSCRLKAHNSHPANRWVLSSGSLIRIPLHTETQDLVFLVRIPHRDEDYDRAYLAKVGQYFARHGLLPPSSDPPRQDVRSGAVDIFRVPGGPLTRKTAGPEGSPSPRPISSERRASPHTAVQSDWKGSGKYNRTGTIGQGAFAVVYKVTSKYDGLPYAAKEIEKRRFIKNGVLDQKVENEMRIMQRVQHPNIVRFIEDLDWEDRLLIIIMEYIPHGDLGKTISPPGPGPFTVEMAQILSTQLLSALDYLHARNITHRDVKPDNILIQSFEPLVVKLTDFGLSKMVDNTDPFLQTFCGTLLYCAPEVYTEYAEYDDNGVRLRGQRVRRMPGQRYNHAVDIWSLGGVVFYCLTAAPPYPVKSGISYSELLHKIMTTDLDVAPLQSRGVSDAGIDFIRCMLQRRPESRAKISDLQTHAWLASAGSTIEASQSYDEILDDEEYLSQLQQLPTYADDRVSDSMSDLSNEENRPSADATEQRRLFGEIGVSALGSSGVLPADFLELRSRENLNANDLLHSQVDEAYDSAGSDTIRGRNHRAYLHNTTCIFPDQSADQLQSLVENVASQSLGGDRPSAPDSQTSPHLSYSMDLNTSKRKTTANDTSEEFDDENTPPGKPIIKRLKPEINSEGMPAEDMEDYRLLVRMPQVTRLESGRQIDLPVSKMEFWEQDQATWHLDYPEMTQLQHDAFKKAAQDGGEEFGPGKTPLWNLAMKYFPPTARSDGKATDTKPTEPDRLYEDMAGFPPTAAPGDSSQMPDTCPPDSNIVVPVQHDLASNRLLALIETHPSSCIPGIDFAIVDSLASFGRGLDNTEVFPDGHQPRVPKYAFKIMLWREGYDPSKSSSRAADQQQPWCRRGSADEASSFYFWISTKATLGIRINGCSLPSSDPKNPSSPSQHWAKIYDGDAIMIWGGQGSDQTSVVFRCVWGGSSSPRTPERSQLELASPQTAARLDFVCQKTERRIKEGAEKKRKTDEARAQWMERKRLVERERERSRVFERKRLQAVAVLNAKQAHGSRRTSPASAPATAHGGAMHRHYSRFSPDKPVPNNGR